MNEIVKKDLEKVLALKDISYSSAEDFIKNSTDQDWVLISTTQKEELPLSDDFLRFFQDRVKWEWLPTTGPMSIDLIEEQVQKGRNFMFAFLSTMQKLPMWFIEKYLQEMTFESLCEDQDLTMEFMEKHKDSLIFSSIGKKQKLTESFIEENFSKFNSHDISENQELSEEFISRHKDELYFDGIVKTQKLSEKFVSDNLSRIDLDVLKLNPNFQESWLDFLSSQLSKRITNKVGIINALKLLKIIGLRYFSKISQYIYKQDGDSLRELKAEDIVKGFYMYVFSKEIVKYSKKTQDRFQALKESKEVDSIISDYVNICHKSGTPVNLRIKAYGRMEKEHDIIAIKTAKVTPIRVSEVFSSVLYKDDSLSIVPIMKGEDLLLEGMKMHNCVASYDSKINRGECGIFHVDFEGSPMTMELIQTKEEKLEIAQIKTKFNGNVKEEIKTKINDALQSVLSDRFGFAGASKKSYGF